jgi:DNA replication protein DnaC
MIQKIQKNDHQSIQKKNSLILDDNESFCWPKLPFDLLHPNYDTHIQQIRHTIHRPLVTPIDPPLPHRNKDNSQKRYCGLMLILFKPWTSPNDLLNQHTNFKLAFETFLQNIDNFYKWQPLLYNMQLLHECQDSRDDHFQKCSQSCLNIACNKEETQYLETDDFNSNDPQTINEMLLNHLTSIDDSHSLHAKDSEQIVNDCLQEAQRTGLFNDYQSFISDNMFPHDLGYATDENVINAENNWLHEYDKRKQKWKSKVITQQHNFTDLNQSQSVSPITICEQNNTQETNINKILPPPTSDKNQVNLNQSTNNICTTLKTFNLNTLQSKAFDIIAQYSLQDNDNQLRMYIEGAGGTGKSHIIDALCYFFQLQNQEPCIRVASFTGVAFKKFRGMTLHSTLSLNKQKKKTNKRQAELIAMWQKVDFLIIDKISMIGCRLLLEIHEALCEAKENIKPFGRIHIIFVDDFAQLPPIGDTKLYSYLDKEKVATTNG